MPTVLIFLTQKYPYVCANICNVLHGIKLRYEFFIKKKESSIQPLAGYSSDPFDGTVCIQVHLVAVKTVEQILSKYTVKYKLGKQPLL